MNLEETIAYFNKYPYRMRNGAGYLAKRCKTSESIIKQARDMVRKQNNTIKFPKILLFDLEMAPMKAYVWDRWEQNISLEQTISETFILCYSAKWLYSDTVFSDKLLPGEIKTGYDYKLVNALWYLLNEADIVIAYNGIKADIPWLYSRFLVYGMPPVKPFITIDPYRTVKQKFGFSSNKMDAVAGYLGLSRKLPTSFSLWRRCMEGYMNAILEMQEYNIQDVKVLEEVYLKLRPWIKNHPNIDNFIEDDVCPFCGKKHHTLIENKYYYTSVNKYPLYRCNECGGVFRGRKAIKNETKNLVCAH